MDEDQLTEAIELEPDETVKMILTTAMLYMDAHEFPPGQDRCNRFKDVRASVDRLRDHIKRS